MPSRPSSLPADLIRADEAAIDRDLLDRIAREEGAALEALVARYRSSIRSLIYRILQDPQEAEDVTADVFWQVWRLAKQYDPSRGTPPAWIFTLARSRAIDRARARRRREDRTLSLDDPQTRLDPLDEKAGADDVVSFRQTRDAVRTALARLPAAQKEAVELAFFGGLTHVEIAEKLGRPLGTIKTRIRQGLLKLREQLD